MSILSFHGTKVFNTFEGGAIVCHTRKLKNEIDQLKNFGITSETTVVSVGMNAKMNEFQAALGLLQVDHFKETISKREKIAKIYTEAFCEMPHIGLIKVMPKTIHNFGYYPILIKAGENKIYRDEVYEILKEHGIFSRRYFYPLITDFTMYKNLSSSSGSNLPVATKISKEILCLPIYPDLELRYVRKVIEIVKNYGA
jgi:dTDP-4-amino-4,6-dideoxygalactose transaminase